MHRRYNKITREVFEAIKRALYKKRKKTTFADIGKRFSVSHMTVTRVNQAKGYESYGVGRPVQKTGETVTKVVDEKLQDGPAGTQPHLPTFSPEEVQQHNDITMLTISVQHLTVAVLDLTKSIKVNNRTQGYANHLSGAGQENKEPAKVVETKRKAKV